MKNKITVERVPRGAIRVCNSCHAPNHISKFDFGVGRADRMYHVTVEGIFELALCNKCLKEYRNCISDVIQEDSPNDKL